MYFNQEKHIFNFVKDFSQYWLMHSKSSFIPSFAIVGKDDSFSAIVIFKNDDDILSVIKDYKIGSGINFVAVCSQINKNKKSYISTFVCNKDVASGKHLCFNCDMNLNIEWLQEHDVSPENKLIFILKNTINNLEAVSINFIDELGFTQERQYYHNIRNVSSYVKKKYDVFILDLLSGKHPDWCDAKIKFEKLLEYLKSKKIIPDDCYAELLKTHLYLGNKKFISEVESIVRKYEEKIDNKILISPALFAETLHLKIFDFDYDLHKSELICW